MGEALDRVAACESVRGSAPLAARDSLLMQLECVPIVESLLHRPDQTVVSRSDVEGDAAGFGSSEFDMLGQVQADDPRLILGCADELASEMHVGHVHTVRRSWHPTARVTCDIEPTQGRGAQ